MVSGLRQITSTFNQAGRYLLATGRVSLTVDLGFCATHVFINRQARLILKKDGHVEAADLLDTFHRELDLGVCWPDGGWGSVHHFYHARTGGGILGRTPSSVYIDRYYRLAVERWRQGNISKAMFFLGAATHLLQDACEPHHSRCSMGIGHHSYETWVKENKENFIVLRGGIYPKYREPIKWLRLCSRKSYNLFYLVTQKLDIGNYQTATRSLLPFTQRITAGFWLTFLEHASGSTGSIFF
ncbi:phospholipase C [Desulfotomaculum arcticum]|uniref:Phospholipase C n=1 Tax=Desulfotruncus arcticus DSM 17038 TaxID=1121424 RepID=A0A1I2P473_9FIRM|nr:zinc dependent phospholipase C family protein [Desulfotruncus arcticus]SFG10955.1 phospholipase C [Desulfotomaculum arcticum] [Desulfotruncus arcticus DSM 17038]